MLLNGKGNGKNARYFKNMQFTQDGLHLGEMEIGTLSLRGN